MLLWRVHYTTLSSCHGPICLIVISASYKSVHMPAFTIRVQLTDDIELGMVCT